MYLRTVILCLIVVLATVVPAPQHAQAQEPGQPEFPTVPETPGEQGACLLYTSDAADDLLCVDLGGCCFI